jgi:hypothetical protein
MVNYHKDLAKATTGEEWRSDLKPINITQPEGPSFSVEGNMVRWGQGFWGGVVKWILSPLSGTLHTFFTLHTDTF